MSDENLPTPALTREEDSFALAMVEYAGNLGAAYRSVYGDVPNPASKARELLSRPEVARRTIQLTEAINKDVMVSLGSHLGKLAEIRDLAIASDQLKVALGAETKRGEAAGFYQSAVAEGSGSKGPVVQITFSGTTPVNVEEWSRKHSTGDVVDVIPKE